MVEPAIAGRNHHSASGWDQPEREDGPVRVAVRGGVADSTLTARKQKKRVGVVVLSSTASAAAKTRGSGGGPEGATMEPPLRRRTPLDGSKKAVAKFSDRMADLLVPKANNNGT